MNLQNILNGLAEVDGELYDRLKHVSRRQIFNFGKKAALAAAPLAFASVLNKSYAQGMNMPDRTVEVLRFALLLEYLEAEFYNRGLSTPNLIPQQDRTTFEIIARHENAHVNFLRTALGSMAEPKPNFDFTAKGQFPDVFSNYRTFLALSQAFEDTGVRAYKGQAPMLINNDPVLTAALRIHSVEARHAAKVRMMRGLKGWITLNQSNGLPPMIYAGEEAVREREVDVPAVSGVPAIKVSEAFDEPLPKDAVLAIVIPFLA